MLVARRDPISNDGAQHRPQPQARLTRAVGLLQMTGTLLGIPVALVSAYSVYHSNFSTEAVCQGLRTNIVSVLDKSADASTVRALVRRDVAAFEQNCGAVDPDAVAAFKSLLTAKAAPPPAAKAAPPPVKNAASEPVHRPDPVKQPAAKPAVAESEPTRHGAEVSDANWLAAVRGALVTHDYIPPRAEPAPPVHTALPAVHAAVPGSAPAPLEARSAPVNLAPPAPELTPSPAAPALPPAASVPAAPAPKVDSSHPVPPGSIPEAAPASEATAQAEPRSRWRALLTHVPGFNRVMEPD
jgi:hypothetical protein